MSDFLIFKAAFNNSATPAIGTYTAEGATAQFNNDPDVSPDYYLYNTAASSTSVQWFVPTKETTDFEFVADILTDDQSLDGDRYFIIADNTGTTGLCMLSSSSITEWRFMNGDGTATSDPEYVGAIDPATSGGFDKFHQFRVRVRKLTASSSSVEVYVDGTLKLTATAGAALVTCAKIGFIGGVTGSPSTSAGIQNVYVYDLSGGELVDRGVLSEGFNRLINWAKNDSGFITSEIDSMGEGWVRFKCGLQICWGRSGITWPTDEKQITISFAKSFIRTATISLSHSRTGYTSSSFSIIRAVSSSNFVANYKATDSVAASQTGNLQWLAIGYWK